MKCATSKRYNSRLGFTLIELIIVMGIMAVISTATLATTRSIQRRSLNSAVLSVQAHIREAQRTALVEGRRWRVQFDQVNGLYHVHPVSGFGSQNPEDVVTIHLPQGVGFDFLGNDFAEFTPRGTAAASFTIILRNGPFEQYLTVLVSTGRVRIGEMGELPSNE